MKTNLIITLLALSFPGVSSAAVLVGFHAFTGDIAVETPGQFLPDFAASTLTKNTNSVSSGGSDDAFYGDSSFTLPTTTPGDGAARITGTLTLRVDYSASATAGIQLGSLLFDYTRTTDSTGLNVYYRINSTNTADNVLLTPSPLLIAAATGTSGKTAYDDYSIDVSNITLNPGDFVIFAFSSNSARLDNIAVTSIPEPSAFLLSALGILPLLRRRHR